MISAYIGDTEAASELLKMTKVQESIFGGFYTGIATIKGNQLYRQRVVGSSSTFESQCKLRDLPGSIGIAHSRTNDGGGVKWAQPRFDEDECIASVGVGILGVLGSIDKSIDLAEFLLSEGVAFDTSVDGEKKNGVSLSNNTTIHAAEAWLIALGRLYKQGKSILDSIREINIRSESVGMYLTTKEPDRIFVANHNSRLLAVKTENAMKLVSSTIGMKEKPIWTMEIPPNSFSTVTRDQVTAEVFWKDENLFDFNEPYDFTSSVLTFISNNPGTSWADVMQETTNDVFPSGKACLGFPMFHRAVEQLIKDGVVRYEEREVTGVEGQCGIPQIILYVNE